LKNSLSSMLRFSERPIGAAFEKSAGGPANLSIAQRERSFKNSVRL
jgi:hypothetical protein